MGVIIAGCTSSSQNIPVTPTKPASSSDPLIGIWEQKLTDTWTYTFKQDGSYTMKSSRAILTNSEGTWKKIQTNQYFLSNKYNQTSYLIYHPETDTLSDASYPDLKINRIG